MLHIFWCYHRHLMCSYLVDDDEEDIHRDDIGQFVELAVKISRRPASKKAKKAAKKSAPAAAAAAAAAAAELSDESDGETKEKPRSARKRSGEDRADPETPRIDRAKKQTRKSETSDDTRDNLAQKMTSPSSTSRYGRARKPVQYENMRSEWSSDATSDDGDDDDFTRGKARARGKPKTSNGAANKKSAGRKRAPPSTDEESDEESEASSVASESSEDLSEDFVEEEEESDFEEDDLVSKKKSARGRKPSATKASESGGKANAGKVGMAESFKPTNHPPFHDKSLKQIHEEKEFLDPCGVEGTDNIIDRLVGNQVDRIGALLSRALRNPKCLGSKENPLKLGTACSGRCRSLSSCTRRDLR